MLSRRSFVSLAAVAGAAAAAFKRVPVGLELFSVRDQLKQDLEGTLRAVAKMGYEGVEFFSPYYEWTPAKAKEVRQLLDQLKLRCFSTHNGPPSFAPENLNKTIELNQALGSKYVVMASAGRVKTIDDWKKVAETLNRTSEGLKPAGMKTGFHNHQLEFTPIDGQRPMEVLAANTNKDVMLQLDVGTCIEAGVDPIAWINQNPGRIRSLHLKDWAKGPDKGYRVLFGEGEAPWKAIFTAAEKTGGVEFYLMEQEGSALTPYETAEKCLATFKKLRA